MKLVPTIFIIAMVALTSNQLIADTNKVSLFSKKGTGNMFLGNHEDARRMMFVVGVVPKSTYSDAGEIPMKSIFTKKTLSKLFLCQVETESYFNTKATGDFPAYERIYFSIKKQVAFAEISYLKTFLSAQEYLFRTLTSSASTPLEMFTYDYIVQMGEFGDLILRPHSSASLSNLNSFYFIRGNMVVSLKRYDKAFDLENLAKFIDEKLVNELQKHGIKILQEAPITTPEEVITTYMKKLNIQPKSRAKTKIQADTIKAFLAEKSVQHEYSFKSTKGRRFWRSPDFPNYSFNSLSKTKSGTFFELFYEDSPWDAQYALFYSAICRTGAITFEQFTNDYRVVKNTDNSIILVGKGKSPLYFLHGNFFLKMYTGEKDKLAVAKRIDQEFLSDFSKETHL